MRILLLNYEFPPVGGGAGNVSAQIARHLVRRGAEVVVLTSHFEGLAREEQRDGYTIHRVSALRGRIDRCSVPEMGAYVASAALPALRLARQFRPDLMHVYFGMPTGPVALFVNQLKGIPYLLSLQGGDVPGFLGNELALLHGVTRPVTKLVWSRAGALIVNSSGLYERAIRTLPDRRIDVVPNGVDLKPIIRWSRFSRWRQIEGSVHWAVSCRPEGSNLSSEKSCRVGWTSSWTKSRWNCRRRA